MVKMNFFNKNISNNLKQIVMKFSIRQTFLAIFYTINQRFKNFQSGIKLNIQNNITMMFFSHFEISLLYSIALVQSIYIIVILSVIEQGGNKMIYSA